MTKSNDCAFPADSQTQTEGGLTKLELFYGMAMLGYLAGRQAPIFEDDANRVSKVAMAIAKQSIAELNKTEQP